MDEVPKEKVKKILVGTKKVIKETTSSKPLGKKAYRGSVPKNVLKKRFF